MATAKKHRWALWLLKLIGVALFIVIVSKINRTELLHALQRTNYPLLLLAFAIQFANFFFKSVRWHSIVHAAGMTPRLSASWELFHIGHFLSLLTPGKVGDFGRAVYLKRAGLTAGKSFALVLIDRLIDTLFVATTGTLAIGYLFGWYWAGLLILIGFTGLAVLWMTWHHTQSFREKWGAILWAEHTIVHRALPKIIATTLLGWACYFAWAILTAYAVGIHLPMHTIAAAMIMGMIAALLPIAPSGLGTRDAALLTILSAFSVPHGTIIAFSLLLFIQIMLTGIPGLVYWMKGHEQ